MSARNVYRFSMHGKKIQQQKIQQIKAFHFGTFFVLLAATFGVNAAPTHFRCDGGETVAVQYPTDHGSGANLIFLEFRGTRWPLREVSDGRHADRLSWRGHPQDAGADPTLVWMETDTRGVLLRQGAVVVSNCGRDDSANTASSTPSSTPSALPVTPPKLPSRAELKAAAPCYQQWGLLTGYEKRAGRWVWGGWNESWGRYWVEAKEADSASFRVLSLDLGLDANAVFVQGTRRDDIHRTSLRWLGGAFFADDRKVYFDCGLMMPILAADPATFSVLAFPWARDRQQCFHQYDTVRACRPATFVPLNGEYAHDGLRAYYRTQVVKGADPASFSVNARLPFDGQDTHSRYQYGERIEP